MIIKKKKMFISGPIDDIPNRRLKRFDELKTFFEGRGYEVFTEIDVPMPGLAIEPENLADKCNKEPGLISWMVITMSKIFLLAKCDSLFLLSGWRKCTTSMIIALFAHKLGMPVYADRDMDVKLPNEDKVRNWFEDQMKD